MNATQSVSCPHCATQLRCAQSMAGRVVQCPRCGQQFRIEVSTPAGIGGIFEDLADGRINLGEPRPTPAWELAPPPGPTAAASEPEPGPAFIPRAHPRRASKRPQATRQNQVAGMIAMLAVGVVLAVLAVTQFSKSQTPARIPDSRVSEESGDIALKALLAVVALVIYFAPTIIAFSREHQNAIPILIINLALGWTFLGWIACFAWAFSSDVRESRQYVRQVIVHDDRE